MQARGPRVIRVALLKSEVTYAVRQPKGPGTALHACVCYHRPLA
jgi:hypothetical protein